MWYNWISRLDMEDVAILGNDEMFAWINYCNLGKQSVFMVFLLCVCSLFIVCFFIYLSTFCIVCTGWGILHYHHGMSLCLHAIEQVNLFLFLWTWYWFTPYYHGNRNRKDGILTKLGILVIKNDFYVQINTNHVNCNDDYCDCYDYCYL